MKKGFAINRSGRYVRKQGGFILGYVLLGVVLISAVIAAIAYANKGTTTPTATIEESKMNANAIIKIGNDLKDASVRYSMDRPLSTMTLTTTANTGLYDPALGFINEVKVPAKAMKSGTEGSFSYDTSTSNYMVQVVGVSDAVCKGINNVIHGDSASAALPTTIGTRTEGCYLNNTNNTYFKVVVSGATPV